MFKKSLHYVSHLLALTADYLLFTSASFVLLRAMLRSALPEATHRLFLILIVEVVLSDMRFLHLLFEYNNTVFSLISLPHQLIMYAILLSLVFSTVVFHIITSELFSTLDKCCCFAI